MTSPGNRPPPAGPKLRFLGGAGTVTGSRFLFETAEGRRVLVECGLFQGLKALRLRNREPFPVPPDSIHDVVLTHAHVDHCGYLPALVRDGFRGRVLCSEGTAALARIVLPDSGHLQEEEAAYANRAGYSRHHPALPLYTEADAIASLGHLEPVPFGSQRTLADGVSVTLHPAGHILGSSVVHLRVPDAAGGEVSVAVSGDLGRDNHPVLVAPTPLRALGRVDTVLVESTYGDRVHSDDSPLDALGHVVRTTAARGGTIVIPAFAVDRTEVVLFHLRELREAGAIPSIPVFADSPMALRALREYRRAVAEHAADIRPELHADDTLFDPGGLTEVRDVEGSKAIDRLHGPKIVVSASGMATGGRVLHHLRHALPDRRNTVVLLGFQAAGTRGRLLAEGARQVKMLGVMVPVRAEVVVLPMFSVHADSDELLAWLGSAETEPKATYAVHGEPAAADTLAGRVRHELGWAAEAPELGEEVLL